MCRLTCLGGTIYLQNGGRDSHKSHFERDVLRSVTHMYIYSIRETQDRPTNSLPVSKHLTLGLHSGCIMQFWTSSTITSPIHLRRGQDDGLALTTGLRLVCKKLAEHGMLPQRASMLQTVWPVHTLLRAVGPTPQFPRCVELSAQ